MYDQDEAAHLFVYN